jgi:hypothetical protein
MARTAKPAPDVRRIEIRSVKEVEDLFTKVLGEAERTAAWLGVLAGSPLELFTALRFEPVGKHPKFPFVSTPAGRDPLTGEPLNLIEQINQTFMVLLSLRAVDSLIEIHPEANGFHLALATNSGCDIESVEPDMVAAKVSAHPGSTHKFQKDMAHLASAPAQHRYMFFAAPKDANGRQAPLETLPGVELMCVGLRDGDDSGRKSNGIKTL